MPDIGVRELKTRASEIVRNVRKRRARYVITYRGRPVGLLVPLEHPSAAQPDVAASGASAWDELVRLGRDIAQGWRSPESSTEILSSMRR